MSSDGRTYGGTNFWRFADGEEGECCVLFVDMAALFVAADIARDFRLYANISRQRNCRCRAECCFVLLDHFFPVWDVINFLFLLLFLRRDVGGGGGVEFF